MSSMQVLNLPLVFVSKMPDCKLNEQGEPEMLQFEKMFISFLILLFNSNPLIGRKLSDQEVISNYAIEVYEELLKSHNMLVESRSYQSQSYRNLLSKIGCLAKNIRDYKDTKDYDGPYDDDLFLSFHPVAQEKEDLSLGLDYFLTIDFASDEPEIADIDEHLNLLSSVVVFNTAVVTQKFGDFQDSDSLDKAYELYSLNMTLLNHFKSDNPNHTQIANTVAISTLHNMREIEHVRKIKTLAKIICQFFNSILHPKALESVILSKDQYELL